MNSSWHEEYAIKIWNKSNFFRDEKIKKTRWKVEWQVQYAAARVITGARHRDPMTHHLRDLHWLSISYHIDFKIAVLTYRCLSGCAPSYLSTTHLFS
jgi:hypothetical protein